jgi:threonine/homoserine/homoserine lactone efflux protein
MILIILLGVIFGYLICIPIGPINIYVLKTKINKGFWPAINIAIGGALMDFFYFSIILSGLSLFEFSHNVSFALQTLGISFLFLLGVKEIFFTKANSFERKPLGGDMIKSSNYALLGILIYLSNPTLFFTISTLCAFIKSYALFESNILNNLIFSYSIAVGSVLWSYTLIVLVKRFEHKLTLPLMLRINKISGGLMIGLSLYLGFKTFVLKG